MKKQIHHTSILYYWYDNGVLRKNGDAEKVEQAIRSHDFETFMKFRDKYPNDPKNDIIFFSDKAVVYDNDTEEIIKYIDITTPENFNKIDDTDYEWG